LREIRPYATAQGARAALDNGGRFYNLFTHARDEVIDAAELARAAGVLGQGQKATLFYEMALADLDAGQRAQVTALLSPELATRLVQQQPQVLLPSAVEAQGRAGGTAIVSGYPVFVEDRTQFSGFIMVSTGKTFIMVPIFSQFDVYEVYDTPDLETPRTVIATTQGSRQLDGVYTRFGGVLKELHFEDKTGKDHGLYLEVAYYTRLEQALQGLS
jgi:hypothetical protein